MILYFIFYFLYRYIVKLYPIYLALSLNVNPILLSVCFFWTKNIHFFSEVIKLEAENNTDSWYHFGILEVISDCCYFHENKKAIIGKY